MPNAQCQMPNDPNETRSGLATEGGDRARRRIKGHAVAEDGHHGAYLLRDSSLTLGMTSGGGQRSVATVCPLPGHMRGQAAALSGGLRRTSW